MSDTFIEWSNWKSTQKQPTCDYLFCRNPATWKLPKNHKYFCDYHANLHQGFNAIKDDYREAPVYIGENSPAQQLAEKDAEIAKLKADNQARVEGIFREIDHRLAIPDDEVDWYRSFKSREVGK